MSKSGPKQFPVNDTKLKELIIYIALKTSDTKNFGRTHLNKVLAWADFITFGNTGKPLIGGDYYKLDNGPVLDNYQRVLAELEHERAIAQEIVPNVPYSTKKVVATRQPDLSMFNGNEIAQIDELIDYVKNKSATKVSHDSHAYFVGWHVTEPNGRIPYETVFLPVSYEPSPNEVEHTKELTAKFNW